MADPLLGEGPTVVSRLARLYSPLIQRSRLGWAAVYHSSNTAFSFAAIRAAFGPGVRNQILEQMREHDPDVVLSVHPLLNHMAFQAIAASGRGRALMTVITDLVEFHRGWAFPRADLVVVPTEEARSACIRRRVPAERIHLLGLPVDLRFRPAAPGEKEALRRRFGLHQDRFTVLVSGGGEGSGKLIQQARALAWRERPWQVIAVCGRNEKLRRRLGRLRFGSPTLVLGFVDDMPDVMRAADVVVSKAGPGAIAEALATGLPLVLTGYLPGQETENVTFVTDHGIGAYAPKPDELLEALTDLADPASGTWDRMVARAGEIARPYASLDIARECLELAVRYSAASQRSR